MCYDTAAHRGHAAILKVAAICGNIWLPEDSFARKIEEQNIFKFKAGNNMASTKSWISPDLLSHDAHALNFTLFLQQLSFLFAATFYYCSNL